MLSDREAEKLERQLCQVGMNNERLSVLIVNPGDGAIVEGVFKEMPDAVFVLLSRPVHDRFDVTSYDEHFFARKKRLQQSPCWARTNDLVSSRSVDALFPRRVFDVVYLLSDDDNDEKYLAVGKLVHRR